MYKIFSKLNKKLLARVSAISMLTMVDSSLALGISQNRVVNSDTDITNPFGFTPNGFNDGDDLTFSGNYTVSFTTNPNPLINILDFSNFNGVVLVYPGINLTTNQVVADLFDVSGTLRFLGASSFDGNINSGHIESIDIGAGIVEFTGNDFTAQALKLTTADSSIKFSGDDTNIFMPIDNTSGNDSSGSIIINNDIVFDQHLGSKNARLEKMIFETDSLAEVRNDDSTQMQITNTYPSAVLGSSKGSLLLWYDRDTNISQDINNNIGLSDLKIKKLAVSSSASDAPENNQVATVKSGTSIYADKFDIYPFNLTYSFLDESTLNIESNTIINAHIVTSPPFTNIQVLKVLNFNPIINIPIINNPFINKIGIVDVQGSSMLSGGIGESDNPMPKVKFSSNDINDNVYFTGDIYALEITQAQPNLILTQDTLFSASNTYTANKSTHTVGLNTFTIKANGSMNDTETFNFSADETKAGRIVIDTTNFNIGGNSGVNHMRLNLTDLTTTVPPDGEREYTIFGDTININGGTVTIPDNGSVYFNIDSSKNPFVQWTYSNGVITQKLIPDVGPVIIDIGSGVVSGPTATGNLGIIANSNSGIRNDLANAILSNEAQEFLDRSQMVIAEVTEDSFDILEDLSGDVTARVRSNSKLADLGDTNTNLKGVAAGEAYERHGVWVSYSLSNNMQGKRGEKPGYKSRSHGATIGADTLINDDTMLGFAVGYSDTKIDHKDSNIGDVSQAKSVLLSLYSVKEFLNNCYVQGQLIFGRTKIDNTELRGTKTRREYAKASFYSNAYAASFELGYNHLTQNKIMVTPLIGLEYDVIGKSRYQETGTVNQNLNVSKRDQKKLIGHTGLMFAKNFNFGNYSVIPEIYGIVRHDFLNKNLKIIARLDGIENSLITRTAQNVPTFYNVGAGITSAVKNTEITLGYDHYFGEKYVSHQGTIKLRLNF